MTNTLAVYDLQVRCVVCFPNAIVQSVSLSFLRKPDDMTYNTDININTFERNDAHTVRFFRNCHGKRGIFAKDFSQYTAAASMSAPSMIMAIM